MPITVTSDPVKITITPKIARVTVSPAGRPGPKGEPGPQGPGGGDSATIEFVQSVPSASWIIAVPAGLARTPNVAVYVDGQLVLTDVTADATSVNVVFPIPTVGSAVLS